MDVLVLQAEHLCLLERAHAAMGAGHEDPHALLPAHGVFGRAAGVTRSRTQDIEVFSTPCQLVLKQIAQQLHGHVFEGQRRAIGQGLQVEAVLQLLERNDLRRAKHRLGIGLAANCLQISGRNVVDIER